MNVDDKLFGVGCKCFLDRSPQVSVQLVSYVIEVDGVHVLVGRLRLHRMEVHLVELILDPVQVNVSILRIGI